MRTAPRSLAVIVLTHLVTDVLPSVWATASLNSMACTLGASSLAIICSYQVVRVQSRASQRIPERVAKLAKNCPVLKEGQLLASFSSFYLR